MTRKRYPAKQGFCVYCGSYGPLTRDHVPPRALFDAAPGNLITVPSCEPCNRGASNDDEYFRIMLTMSADLHEHPVVQEIWPKVLRSINNPNKAIFAQSIRQAISKIHVLDSNGQRVGVLPGYEVDGSRIVRVVERITRGLYYFERRERLPASRFIRVVTPNDLMVGGPELVDYLVSNFVAPLVSRQPKAFGNGVFEYWMLATREDPASAAWLLRFYGGWWFLVFSFEQEAVDQFAAEAGLKAL